MLETEDYQTDYSRGYYCGKRMGLIEATCSLYKEGLASKDEGLLSIFKDDTREELDRFFKQYGSISYNKLAEHIMRESEFMIEMK